MDNKLNQLKTFAKALAFTVLFMASIALAAQGEAQTKAAATNGSKTYSFKIDASNLNAYNEVTRGHDIYDLQSWEEMGLDRMLLEMLVFQVAPVLGGCDCVVEFEPDTVHTVHGRSIAEVKTGRQLSHPITVFSDDPRVQEDVYLSEPILSADDFYVGFYTHYKREDVLRAISPQAIKTLTFVAAKNWEMDNAILRVMGVHYVNSDNWETALNQIIAGRADVILQPFHASEDFFFSEGEDRIFLPIKNFKMPFPQGRRYFVSSQHEDGQRFVGALNNGIKKIDGDDGFLRKAHIWAGVINPETEDFQVVFGDLKEADIQLDK